MTRDEALELFDALTTPGMESPYDQDCEEDISALERAFAAVAAAEREACAAIVEGIIAAVEEDTGGRNYDPKLYVMRAAAAIRARGQK